MFQMMSRTGADHAARNMENQDVVQGKTSRGFSVITLADGVSTCQQALCGAQAACSAVTDLLIHKGEYFLSFAPKDTALFITSHVLRELREIAAEHHQAAEEYSSTVASVLYDAKHRRMLYWNLGDSMIFTVGKKGCRVLSAPADSRGGCPVTTTKNAQNAVDTAVIDAAEIEAVMICSDGAWRQMTQQHRLNGTVTELLMRRDYQGLCSYLEKCGSADDCSFIAMGIAVPKGV